MTHRLMFAMAGLLWLAGSAHGQDAAPAPQTTETQKKAGEPEKEKAKEKAKKKGNEKDKPEDHGFRWDDHPSWHFGKGSHVDFRFRLQADVKDSDAPLPENQDGAVDTEASEIDIARRRIGVDGEIRNLVEFQIERELRVESDAWRDVYVNYKQFAFVQVQAGKFKLPFSLDENTSATNLDFVFRSRAAAQLSPGRDRGVMVHGRVLDRGLLRYEAGLFDHDGRNAWRRTQNDRVHGERTTVARLTVQPYRGLKSPLSDLAFGAAFTSSNLQEGFPDLRGRTALDLGFYRPDVWVEGTRRRFGLELRWRPGPFSVKSEYIRLTDERRGQSVEDTDLSELLATGWYVSGTWAITGEKKADGLDRPRRPLFPTAGHGAIEVAARVERLRFGSSASGEEPSAGPRADVILGNSDRAETFGVKWYVNRWIKIQLNLIRETIAKPDQGPLPSQPTFWSRILRFQFSM